ncbi:hypothetical protein GO003_022935 [Methylicorpusculum oleiharenae]|uniref:hypothetical protein n=1 Tax=Methylicorpusculum oleiharenae TaxID=1338687 RepID=UPI00135C3ED3|nr:hypothetical protein [Methylicorpusculum oleiharenae]MCD2453241.1 hypothetical protein [Methylicorpusculum oleiharenae]
MITIKKNTSTIGSGIKCNTVKASITRIPMSNLGKKEVFIILYRFSEGGRWDKRQHNPTSKALADAAGAFCALQRPFILPE